MFNDEGETPVLRGEERTDDLVSVREANGRWDIQAADVQTMGR